MDEHGLIEKVNLIIATGQNNLAMNRTVAQIARKYIHGPKIPEGILNRVEAGIRLIASDGRVLDVVRREVS